jgi:hypothetical protein
MALWLFRRHVLDGFDLAGIVFLFQEEGFFVID